MKRVKSYIPKLNSGPIPLFFPREKIYVPSSKTISTTPVINQPDSDFINNGITCINYNSGMGVDAYPVTQRAVFIENPTIIKNATNGSKPLSQYSDDECKALVQGWLSGRPGGYRIITTGFNESGGPSLDAWRLDPLTVPNQCRVIDREFARLMPGYRGDYGGFLEIGAPTEGFGNLTPVDNAFASGQAAYEFLKTASGFGDLFFVGDECMHRGGCIKVYWGGYTDAWKRLAMFLCGFILTKMALAYKGSSARIAPFAFPGKTEFAGYNQHYVTDVPGGGQYECNTFPQYSDDVQVILAYLCEAFCDDPFLWEDTTRRGTNPAVIRPDLVIDGHVVERYVGSGNPQRGAIVNSYNPNVTAGYVECRYSGHDAWYSGFQLFGRSALWAGETMSFPRIRTAGSSNWPVLDKHPVLDSYKARRPIAIMNGTGNNKSVFIYGPDKGSYEVDLGGGATISVDLEPMLPYHELIDLAA